MFSESPPPELDQQHRRISYQVQAFIALSSKSSLANSNEDNIGAGLVLLSAHIASRPRVMNTLYADDIAPINSNKVISRIANLLQEDIGHVSWSGL